MAVGDAAAVALAVAVVGPSDGDAVAYVVALAVLMVLMGAFRPRVCLQAVAEAPSYFLWAALALVLVAPLSVTDGISSGSVALACVTAGLLLAGRSASYATVRSLRRHRRIAEPVVVVGAGPVGTSLGRELDEQRDLGMPLVGFVDDIDPAGAPAPLLGELDALPHVLRAHAVRRVIVAFGACRDGELLRVLRTAVGQDVEVYVVPRFPQFGVEGDAGQLDSIGCTPLQRLCGPADHTFSWRAKRAFDVVVAGAVLVMLLPLLGALAVMVRLSSPGPILFRQTRVGQHGRTFELLKFRSLRMNADSDVRWSVVGDDRQTAIGRWMRRLSLDELPQLWNVVRGDMSLVGPRPERPHFVAEFSVQVDDYDQRHRLPVGLTGWAQINGLRGNTSIAERARFDNYYIDHWSLRRDLAILAGTVAAVVRDARSKRSG